VPVPILASTSPLDQATDTNVEATISFTFNTALLASSVSERTMGLWRDDTAEIIPVNVSLSSDLKTIQIMPDRGLLEDVVYVAAVYGASDGMPGGNIKASDGIDLPDTHQIEFRTAVERYVSLTEAADRTDIIQAGPIREDSDFGQVTGVLDIQEAYPSGFESGVNRSLSEIWVDFGQAVQQTGSATALELSIINVLGMDEYYGEGDPRPPDPTGRVLQDWLATGDVRQADFATDPYGAVSFSGDTVRWDIDPDSPPFHYNSEVTVRVRSDYIVNTTGHMLAEDVYITFTTEYWPMYVGVEYIRLQLGRLVADLWDDTIRRHIHAASIDAVDHAAGMFDVEHPYPAVRRYVRSISILRILDEIGLLSGLQSGSKQLGDLKVDYRPQDLAKVIAAYRRAEKEKDRSLIELRAYRRQSRPRVVVKGSSYAFERTDYYLRTWQHHRNSSSPSANTTNSRRMKSLLSHDHPSIDKVYYIGEADEALEGGASFPWHS